MSSSARKHLRAFLDRNHQAFDGSKLDRRAALFDAISNAILGSSRRMTVALVIDDLQWVDEDSIELFEYLAVQAKGERAGGPLPCSLLIAGAFRDPDGADEMIGQSNETAAERGRGNGLEMMLGRLERFAGRIRLEGLNSENTRVLLTKELGIANPSWQLVETIQHATDGNPLFTAQVVGHLRRSNQLTDLAGFTGTPLASEELRLPTSCTGAITSRAQALTPECRDVLVWGAFLGNRFSIDALATVRDEAACAWGSAARYYEASIDAATRLGSANIRLLGELHHRAGLVHHHAWDAGPALHHYDRAVELLEKVGDLAGQARSLSDRVRLSDNLGETSGEQTHRIAELEKLRHRLATPGLDPGLDGRILETLATCALGSRNPARVQELAQQALEIAIETNDIALRLQVTSSLAVSLLQQMRVREAADRWRAGIELAYSTSELTRAARHLQRLPMALHALGEIEELEGVLERAEDLNDRVGNAGERSLTTASQLTLAAMRGDCGGAERRAVEALEQIARSTRRVLGRDRASRNLS